MRLILSIFVLSLSLLSIPRCYSYTPQEKYRSDNGVPSGANNETTTSLVKSLMQKLQKEDRENAFSEDTLLVMLFEEMLLKPMLAHISVPAHALPSLKEEIIKTFQWQLKNTPKDPFFIEKFGFFPILFCLFSFGFAAFASLFQRALPISIQPNRWTVVKCALWALLFSIIQFVLVGYRIYNRSQEVFQKWIQYMSEMQSGSMMNRRG